MRLMLTIKMRTRFIILSDLKSNVRMISRTISSINDKISKHTFYKCVGDYDSGLTISLKIDYVTVDLQNIWKQNITRIIYTTYNP